MTTRGVAAKRMAKMRFYRTDTWRGEGRKRKEGRDSGEAMMTSAASVLLLRKIMKLSSCNCPIGAENRKCGSRKIHDKITGRHAANQVSTWGQNLRSLRYRFLFWEDQICRCGAVSVLHR